MSKTSDGITKEFQGSEEIITNEKKSISGEEYIGAGSGGLTSEVDGI